MTFSVKFFKRVFLIILLLLIIVPMFFAFYNGFSLGSVKASNETLKTELEETRGELEELKQSINEQQAASFAYQSLYPELYCSAERPDGWVRSTDTIYLTFNDGPSENTDAILNILAENNVKATFFVTGKTDEVSLARMRRIVEEGHTIGIYTYGRQYREMYASVEAYLEDFKQMYDLIYQTTGVKPEIFRFAGGSINGYNILIYQQLIAEMTRRGFTYYDWSATGGDNVAGIDATTVKTQIIQQVGSQDRAVVLLHDGTEYTATVEALPQLIAELGQQGYSFAPLSSDVTPVIFGYESIP